ncbi:hypothetical protein XENOCAPTIV_008458 [Xenoophorus captivus]|uniref:Guanylate-binding protein N-terminal domain-containing protein n=1 Tax=Xenoophorus captivus TaxID=1517983 RepID=A0ABV0Q8T1_9TELE
MVAWPWMRSFRSPFRYHKSHYLRHGGRSLMFVCIFVKCLFSPFNTIFLLQSLMFLVRDWSFPYEYKYGFKGGNDFLDKRLQVPVYRFQTPAVLFVLMCLLYVLSGVLLFVGLSTFALVCDCGLGLLMIAMLAWAFIRYSGQYRPVGGAIDQAAGVVLEQVRTQEALILTTVCNILITC